MELNNLPISIIDKMDFMFNAEEFEEIPSRSQALELITKAIEKGRKYKGKSASELGELAESYTQRQIYINMALDDAVYEGFMQGVNF